MEKGFTFSKNSYILLLLGGKTMNKLDRQKLKEDIEEYIRINGNADFFSLLAEILTLNTIVLSNKVSAGTKKVPSEEEKIADNTQTSVEPIIPDVPAAASIYAEEHIPAVLEDKNRIPDSQAAKVVKARVAPNNFPDARTLTPSQ